MSDDDPYRAPDSETEPIEGAIRPMSAPLAAGWAFLATFLFVFVAGLVLSLRSEASGYLVVTGVLAQVVAYSLTLFFMLRVHAPDASIRRFIGLRPTAWGFYLLGALLGLAMQLPMNALYAAVLERFPLEDPSTLQPYYDGASLPLRMMMGFVLVAAGPAIEEVFFRGALFAPLVRRPERNSGWVTIVATGLLFAAAHVWRWQDVLCIIPMGIVLGYLRHASGSLLPSIFAHACFNAVAMAQLAIHQEDMRPTPTILALTIAATAAVVLGIVWLARASEPARMARVEDAS